MFELTNGVKVNLPKTNNFARFDVIFTGSSWWCMMSVCVEPVGKVKLLMSAADRISIETPATKKNVFQLLFHFEMLFNNIYRFLVSFIND